MATKQQLISRTEYIKSQIEIKGGTFNYVLPKNFKKDDIFKILNEADLVYKNIK